MSIAKRMIEEALHMDRSPKGRRRAVEERLVDAEGQASTDWEIEFVADVRRMLGNTLWIPTNEQVDKLEEIAQG